MIGNRLQSLPSEVRRHAGLLVCLALILVTLAVYWPVRNYGFVAIDDEQYVTRNGLVTPGLTLKGLAGAFSLDTEPYWHPLTWISHMIDTELYGLNPRGHHWNSLLLHVVNVLLLFAFLRRVTGALWRSAAVAALFAIHPLNVESVAWIASRKNLLGAFFGLLTLLAYLRYAARPGAARYGLLLISFGLGLMAKPMLVTLPILLLAIDFWPLGRLRLRSVQPPSGPTAPGRGWNPSGHLRLVLEKAPLALLSIASVAVSILTAQGKQYLVALQELPATLRIENALVSIVTYLSKTFWPSDLAFFYPFPSSIPRGEWIVAGILLIGLSGLCVSTVRRAPYLLVGWLWFLITLLPVMGLAQQGVWPAWADRFAYVPLIGIFWMVVWALSSMTGWDRRARIPVIAGFLVLLLLLGVSGRNQARFWEDGEKLFRRAVEVAPPNHLGHYSLGALLLSRGKSEEAVEHYARAVRILPGNPLFHYGLGSALLRTGAFEEAARNLEDAVRLSPSYAEAHTNLAVALMRLGRQEEAIRHLQTAIRLKPLPEAFHNLGIIQAGQGRYADAVASYRSALRLAPSDPMIHNDLGVALCSMGEYREALSQVSEALRLSPKDARLRHNLQFIQDQMKQLPQDNRP